MNFLLTAAVSNLICSHQNKTVSLTRQYSPEAQAIRQMGFQLLGKADRGQFLSSDSVLAVTYTERPREAACSSHGTITDWSPDAAGAKVT